MHMKNYEILSKLRKNQKFAAKDIAKKLNIAPQTLSGYENGSHEPPIEILSKLANLYGVSLDYLIKGEDNGITITVEEYQTLMKIKNVLSNLENRYENLNKSINIQADNNSGTIIVGDNNSFGDKK